MYKIIGTALVLSLSAISAQAATIFSAPVSSGIGIGASPAAVDVSIGDDVTLIGTFDPSVTPVETQVNFTFTALEDLIVTGLSLTANGAAVDISAFTIETTPPLVGDTMFSVISPSASNAVGFAFYDEFSVLAGEDIVLNVNIAGGVANGASVTLQFDTIAPVPLPAALPLMLGAVGGLFALRRKSA